ncbi:MAG: N-acetylmuramoyl-L-alanine amidase [Crocinitomicaceae bacterium]|jgi:N-acetylmuramoyl-L-alanine amidase
MPRKNLALEISLVVCALLGAFILQAVVSQSKPPKMPKFEASHYSKETLEIVVGETVAISENHQPSNAIPVKYDKHQSALGHAPQWNSLDAYQYTVSRSEFIDLMRNVYSVGPYWKDWFTLEAEHVMIKTHASDLSKTYKLTFRNEVVEAKPKKFWRTKAELGESSESAPLLGLRIAIDPGHIGGDYAEIEHRRFILKDGVPPIQEGNMTLTVAELLVNQLESLGATAHLVRDKNSPVNPFRPQDYYAYAVSKLVSNEFTVTEQSVKREAEKLFYRNGEIRARAELVNQELKPDIVLCLHFNANAEPDPEEPSLYEKEHFHMILNGAYTQSELAHDDERFQCVLKILQGNHAEEALLTAAAAASFHAESGLPPYQYISNSSRAVNIDGNPFLWARNLIANRLYDCPVLYFEPYLMNGKDSYTRMQIGGYSGLGFVNGKLRPSIYREYVNAVTKGLVDYYTAEVAVEKSPEVLVEDPQVIDPLVESVAESNSKELNNQQEEASSEAVELEQPIREVETE